MGIKVSKRNTVIVLVNQQEDTPCGELRRYFQRPIVYYYFGLPLLAPTVMLIIVSSVPSSDLNSVFIAIGYILFFLCVSSFATGIILGIRGRRQVLRYQRQLLLLDQAKLEAGRTSTTPVGRNVSTPGTLSTCASSTGLSSRRSSSNSSLSSLGSHSSSVNILSTANKSKLITIKKKSMRRKRGVKFPVERLPSLIEEDSFVKSYSRTNSQSKFGQDMLPKSAGGSNRRPNVTPSKENLDELKNYLSAIGLGGGGDVPRAAAPLGMDRRAKSFDEEDYAKIETRGQSGTLHGIRSERRQSVSTPRSDKPVLVSVSHERTGIRVPNLR